MGILLAFIAIVIVAVCIAVMSDTYDGEEFFLISAVATVVMSVIFIFSLLAYSVVQPAEATVQKVSASIEQPVVISEAEVVARPTVQPTIAQKFDFGGGEDFSHDPITTGQFGGEK